MAERMSAPAKKKGAKKKGAAKKRTVRQTSTTPGQNALPENVADEIYDRHIKILRKHDVGIKKKREELRQLTSQRSNAVKLAKKGGCNGEALKEAFRLHEKDHSTVIIDTRDTGRVLRLMKSPLATDLELFQNVVIPLPLNATLAGQRDGRTGADRHNTYMPGSTEFENYEEAYNEEQAKIVKKMGPPKDGDGGDSTLH